MEGLNYEFKKSWSLIKGFFGEELESLRGRNANLPKVIKIWFIYIRD